jgi:hypothetical protein
MNNLNLVRGVFLVAISLAFGLTSFGYKIGDFSRAGPGLFPAVVSGLLFLIGIASVIKARYVKPVPIDYSFRNIVIIIVSLAGFAFISEHINMLVGIFFLAFSASYAGRNNSLKRNIKIGIGLSLVACGFKFLLHLNLPLI